MTLKIHMTIWPMMVVLVFKKMKLIGVNANDDGNDLMLDVMDNEDEENSQSAIFSCSRSISHSHSIRH